MVFIVLMFLTTTCVAGAAAFFSVYGLAHTFTAAFWSVVFMGGALEAGKLMITSYLYRFNDTLSFGRKWLGIIFVFGLMLITSLGIYGYLADAYQAGSTDMKQINATLELKKTEQADLQKRKTDIDGQIALIPAKDVRGKQRLMTQYGPEINTINKRLIEITAELQADTQKQITTDSHVGPIIFIAKIVGLEPDRAMSYFILFIIFMFDPVAIYLTVATNEAMAKYKARTKESEPAEPMSYQTAIEAETEARVNAAHVPFTEDLLHMQTNLEAASQQEAKGDVVVDDIVLEPDVVEVDDIILDPDVMVPDDILLEPDVVRVVPDPIPLQEVFSAHPSTDVAPEDEVDDPVESLREIYDEALSKEHKTPVDIEAVQKIERFFARQELVKNVRTGNINQ